ncbi:MAG: glycosyltransferase family 2 protein [Deltaproteobacteria bacterium]
MDLSIIIVNFKSKDFTEACVKSIYQNTKNISFEVIVVDNNSGDGCIEMLSEKFPQVIGYENKENAGFSKGNNIGMKLAKGRYLLLLNPDTIVFESTLDKMVEYMDKHSDVGVSGCRVENPDGTLQRACRRSVPTPKIAFFQLSGLGKLFPKSKILAKYNLSYIDENQETEVDAVSGAFLTFRREVYEQIGGLDEDYFMYAEDIDFCFRAKQKGWKIMYYPDTRITHFKGQSSKHMSMKATKAFYDSMAIFFNKNYSKKTNPILKFFVYFGIWLLKQAAILKVLIRDGRSVGTKG